MGRIIKVIQSSTYAPYEEGGLRMIDYETTIKVMGLSWLMQITLIIFCIVKGAFSTSV